MEEKKAHRETYLKPFMKPRPGWVIIRQWTNFHCAVCRETDFPTLPSLVHHQRKEHSVQLSQIENWINCSGCNQNNTSLTWIRSHISEAAAAAAVAGTRPLCTWATASLRWQAEQTSEEAQRFLSGLDPVPPSPSSPIVGYDEAPNTPSESRKRQRNKRADKSYILPRPGHHIVRRQQNLVCQLCTEGGFMTCASIDHHMRKMHKAGIHEAGMWMHCARCALDFCNITSVRMHVERGGGQESCSWQNIFMCWHEMKEVQVKFEETENDISCNSTIAGSLQEIASMCRIQYTPAPKRHRKLFKPPARADEGYEIVKCSSNMPCFACDKRSPTLQAFIWHMQGKHHIYFSDIGAWLECACGSVFTSTTTLRVHIRESGGDVPVCSMNYVSLCWQHKLGGQETETPCWPGAQVARDSAEWARSATEEDAMCGEDVYEPIVANGVVKEEPISGDAPHEDSVGAHNTAAECAPGMESFINSLLHPIPNGVVKEEEEDEIMERRVDGVSERTRNFAIFDPTRYADGDRFVLRKEEGMRCRICQKVCGTPRELAGHLRIAHEAETRGTGGNWHDQWVECASCRRLFHAAAEHELHLLQTAETCSIVDARLCWMQVQMANGSPGADRLK